jgi:phosphoribosylamine--glycine ligase
LTDAGIPVFGPSRAAARIESSKAWAKEVMAAAGVPTARSTLVAELPTALAALADYGLPVVIKADGLASGKGVVVAETRDEARLALTAFLEQGVLGEAGRWVVIEEWLSGPEVSVFGITDGASVLTLPPACDHKRAYDGDRGPNTGGMGAYAPTSLVHDAMLDDIRQRILQPVVREMATRGAPMRGVLYAGLMLTPDGPRVLEFNARFGDPETQVVLPLADLDLLELCEAVAHGTLADLPPVPAPEGAAVGIVLASGGYPGPYRTDLPVEGIEAAPDDVLLFHAGTKRGEDGVLLTSGGRVMTVVGLGADLAAARERAQAGVAAIGFEGVHARTDIAGREIGS